MYYLTSVLIITNSTNYYYEFMIKMLTKRSKGELIKQWNLQISGGAAGGPAGHWPTQFSVWPTQFIGLSSFLAHPFFVLGPPSFLAV